MLSHSKSTIITRRQGRIGRITINRPKALNALDRGMIRIIRAALDEWRDIPAIHAVVIEGAGGQAFCAGGDIRWIRDMVLAGRHADVEAFFVDEYALNLVIARYPKPYISLIDGVCMGGGIGLSVHGSIRVVTDTAVLAMPETGIGFFPDVGASFFLPRLRAGFGMYLALTGARVRGSDAAYVGLATHYVPRNRIGTLADEIAKDGIAALSDAIVLPIVGKTFGLSEAVHCFDADSLLEVIERLTAMNSTWAQGTLAILRAMSPSATVWSFELIRRGANRTLEQCQAAELAMVRHATRQPDFLEGVRAMVVDKDRTPRWFPARIEDINIAEVVTLFA